MRNNSPTSQRSNHLPLEIWLHIFLHACADGGYTGYSLTLVSKFFHHASQLVRFHSLAFTSLRRIEGFLAFAEHTTTIQAKKPKVHHLLLSFSRSPSHEASPEFGRSEDIYGANLPVADVWFRARQAREQEKASWDKRFVIVVSALLDLVGPHLETLALLQSDAFAIPPLRYRLPRLRELTLLMGITVILNEDLPESRFEGPPSDGAPSTLGTRSLGYELEHAARARRFPALERLHIICGRHRDWTLRDALHHLPRLAPNLAYLRISNATYTHGSHDCIAAFLRAALDVPRAEDDRDGAGASSDLDPFTQTGSLSGEHFDQQGVDLRGRAMPRLRRVVVHSIPPPPDAQCATSHKGYRALSDAMKELLAACELAPDMRLQWRESERVKHHVWEEVCRARWVDRIEGRSGFLRSLEPAGQPQDWPGL
ncbi:hypothetical protein LXA43DRAFT_971435 [Ganoderma leucocontextum]|nr:hypothetical protein LXA43DRAFT_971435 [Ganoderma leucocontextum]